MGKKGCSQRIDFNLRRKQKRSEGQDKEEREIINNFLSIDSKLYLRRSRNVLWTSITDIIPLIRLPN